MKSIVLDTDIFIDHLKKSNSNFKLLLRASTEKNYKLYVPTVVLVELFVGYEFLESFVLKKAEDLLKPFERIVLTEDIAKLAGEIGRNNRIGFLGTVDLVIGATALSLNAEVATRNVKHFKQIPGLKLFNFKQIS